MSIWKKKLQKSFYTHMRRYFLQFEKSYLAKLWLKHLFFFAFKGHVMCVVSKKIIAILESKQKKEM